MATRTHGYSLTETRLHASRCRPCSSTGRLGGAIMLFLQLWLSIPPQMLAATPAAVPGGASNQTAAPASPHPPHVTPNRTLPPGISSAPPPPAFTADTSEAELCRTAIFAEPLIPVGRKPTAAENRALARMLEAYLHRDAPEDVSALAGFAAQHTNSPWRVAILFNLGLLHYHACRFSKTFPVWEEAWKLGKGATEPGAEALVDRAVAELIRMNARVGRIAALDGLFAELGERPLSGSANEIVASARQGLYRMKNEPWIAFRCGPLALDRIMAFENPNYAIQDCTYHSRSTTNGLSLQQVHELSQKMGLKMQPAKRQPGSAILLPAVIHWKVGHYAALVKENNGKFLVQDLTFGPELWVSRETLEQEASGAFLVNAGNLPRGWSMLGAAEAGTVFGKGDVGDVNLEDQGDNSANAGGDGDSNQCQTPSPQKGMARYTAKAMAVSLHLEDMPVGYLPPRGPSISFTLAYTQREPNQPANFTYANFGPKWTFNWISYVTDDPSNPSANVAIYRPGGGTDRYSGFNSGTSTYSPEIKTRTLLTRSSPSSYVLSFPDGSKHLFARPVGATSPRKVFLTGLVDPRGNAVDLFYDATNRLVAIRDAVGQVSTISYEISTNSYAITRITDPFGRSAFFGYQGSRLASITDVIGIQSSFTYGSGDFINTLTTPYGTSRFRSGQDGVTRWLEMSDPDGATERIEFRNQTPGLPFTDPTGVPKTIEGFNQYIWSRNTFYWDKKAFREAAGDYTRARISHWLHDVNPSMVSGILESEKQPLENRVWYNYPGQTWAGGVNAGMTGQPSKIGRILDDGTTQIYRYEYNDLGRVTKAVDPMGRTTVYTYATNLIDLVEVRQTAGVNEVLATATYNTQHLPLTVANGSGHTNRFAYNPAGQLLTATNPRNETTTLNYDTNGYLLSVDGPLPGTNDSTGFTYDGYGRARTVTDSEGYTLTYDYDALDRRTRTTYPDGSYEEDTYQNLDRVASRDRNGRITYFGYDANRHLTSVEDPLHRITRYDWCSCGQMEALIDPMGRTTKWHRDIQGRVTAKEYVDGSQVRYTYEGTTSRLKTVTDEKGQVKLYDYLPDDNVWRVSYLNAENPTPTVTFSYDGPYNRIKTMTDGIGLTTYGYFPASTNGGRLAFVDSPLPNDTVTYDYDELGRVRTRAIDGVAQRWNFDPLGRVTEETNALGAFTRSYVGPTFRLAATLFPNGQTTDYSYYDNLGDQRLKEIHHRLPGNQTLSRFEYAYDRAGQITNWLQQAGSEVPENWTIGYDDAQQLLSVVSTTNDVVSQTYGYAYDPAGNRLIEETNGVRRNFGYNLLNQIETTDTPFVPARSHQWDAANRLVGIVQGTNRYEITYDGQGRYVRVKQWNGPTLVIDLRYLWCGNGVCQARDSTGATVLKRFFSDGQAIGAQPQFYARDHLGSLRELTDRRAEIQGRYTYSPFGTQAASSGAAEADLGFTGHQLIESSRMLWTRFRGYDASMARWLSRDPLMEVAGLNLLAYVENDPINRIDPLGLDDCPKKEDPKKKVQEAVEASCKQNPDSLLGVCSVLGNIHNFQNQVNALGNDLCKKYPGGCATLAGVVAGAVVANGYPQQGVPIDLGSHTFGSYTVSGSVTPGGSGLGAIQNLPTDVQVQVQYHSGNHTFSGSYTTDLHGNFNTSVGYTFQNPFSK